MVKCDVCTDKDINVQPFQNTKFRQNFFFKLLKKDIFKVDNLKKVVNSKDIPGNTQVFDSSLVNKKNSGTDKAY